MLRWRSGAMVMARQAQGMEPTVLPVTVGMDGLRATATDARVTVGGLAAGGGGGWHSLLSLRSPFSGSLAMQVHNKTGTQAPSCMGGLFCGVVVERLTCWYQVCYDCPSIYEEVIQGEDLYTRWR